MQNKTIGKGERVRYWPQKCASLEVKPLTLSKFRDYVTKKSPREIENSPPAQQNPKVTEEGESAGEPSSVINPTEDISAHF